MAYNFDDVSIFRRKKNADVSKTFRDYGKNNILDL